MAELMIKTRSSSGAVGKPKVYFCATDADFEKHFSSITELIFDYNECAVFYKDPKQDYSDGEYRYAIAEMQLVVVPITSKLLTDGDEALEDIMLAREKRLPILPIMVEAGLAELFNKVFAELQYVDKTSKDPTGIKFEKKIEKFLSAVLIGDELSEKIRAAFDAYVFLSYRKKDREHAQRLMRLVHENPACRDIAIWYDEFLVPGENFNQSIKRALERSDLFLLAVTPNLVNEHNYVEQIEYPMAREEGKPILPVEMVPTDRESLGDRFKDIPTATPAEAELISKNLILAIERIALRKNDSPEHTYFIGLAYLSGIDVEVDFDKAVKLITEAADAGVYDAIERLITMYRGGVGVERSYEKAVEWEERKNAILEATYSEKGTFDAFCALFEAYVQNADHERDLYRYDGALAKYERALALVCNSGYSERADDMVFDLHIRMGDVFREQMRFSDAERSYLAARATCERQKSAPDDVYVKRLAACLDRLGDVMLAEGHSHGAVSSYKDALSLAEKILAEGDVEDRRLLAELYYSLGKAFYEDGLYEQAVLAIDKASNDMYELLLETVNFEYMRDLYKYNMLLFDMYMAEGDEKNADNSFWEAFMFADKLVEVFDDIEAHRMHINIDNIECTYNRSERYLKYHDIENVLDNHEKLFKEYDKYFANVMTPGIMSDMIKCAVNYAVTLSKAKRYEEAVEQADAALQIAIYSARENPSIKTEFDLGNTYYDCSNIATTYEEAIDGCERAISIYERLLNKTDLSGIRLNLVKALSSLGVMLYKTGKKELGKEKFLLARKITLEMLDKTSSSSVKRECVSVLSNLRVVSYNEGRFDEALEFANEAVGYIEEMLSRLNSIDNRKKLAKQLEGRASVHKKLGNVSEMNSDLARAEYCTELAIRIEDNEELDFLSSFFSRMDKMIRNGDYERSKKQACDLFVMALETDKELLLYPNQLAMTLEKLSRICKLIGDEPNEERYRKEAELCRSGDEGERIVRANWLEPCADYYKKKYHDMRKDVSGQYEKKTELLDKAIERRRTLAENKNGKSHKIQLAELLVERAHLTQDAVIFPADEAGKLKDIPLLREWGTWRYDIPEAREYFKRAHDIYCELAEEYAEREDILNLARSYSNMATYVTVDIDEAQSFILKAFDVLKKRFGSLELESDLSCMSEAYGILASFYTDYRYDPLKATKYKEKSADISAELFLRYGYTNSYHIYYKSDYSSTKRLYQKAGDAEGADRCRAKLDKILLSEVERLEAAVRDAATPKDWERLIKNLYELGDNSDNDVERKKGYYLRAFDVAMNFDAKVASYGSNFELVQCCLRLFRAYEEDGSFSDAIKYGVIAADKYADLEKRASGRNFMRFRMDYLKRVSKLYERLGDGENSSKYLSLAKEAEKKIT